jgi:acyl-CoA thioesterase
MEAGRKPDTPGAIVQTMMAADRFSRWLGLEIEEVREGYCRLRMEVRPDMLNGFSFLHGGVSFSMADSCFAFASNSLGRLCVSLQASAHFPRPARAGDVLEAESTELSRSRTALVMDIEVRNRTTGERVCLFRATGHRFPEAPFEKEKE